MTERDMSWELGEFNYLQIVVVIILGACLIETVPKLSGLIFLIFGGVDSTTYKERQARCWRREVKEVMNGRLAQDVTMGNIPGEGGKLDVSTIAIDREKDGETGALTYARTLKSMFSISHPLVALGNMARGRKGELPPRRRTRALRYLSIIGFIFTLILALGIGSVIVYVNNRGCYVRNRECEDAKSTSLGSLVLFGLIVCVVLFPLDAGWEVIGQRMTEKKLLESATRMRNEVEESGGGNGGNGGDKSMEVVYSGNKEKDIENITTKNSLATESLSFGMERVHRQNTGPSHTHTHNIPHVNIEGGEIVNKSSTHDLKSVPTNISPITNKQGCNVTTTPRGKENVVIQVEGDLTKTENLPSPKPSLLLLLSLILISLPLGSALYTALAIYNIYAAQVLLIFLFAQLFDVCVFRWILCAILAYAHIQWRKGVQNKMVEGMADVSAMGIPALSVLPKTSLDLTSYYLVEYLEVFITKAHYQDPNSNSNGDGDGENDPNRSISMNSVSGIGYVGKSRAVSPRCLSGAQSSMVKGVRLDTVKDEEGEENILSTNSPIKSRTRRLFERLVQERKGSSSRAVEGKDLTLGLEQESFAEVEGHILDSSHDALREYLDWGFKGKTIKGLENMSPSRVLRELERNRDSSVFGEGEISPPKGKGIVKFKPEEGLGELINSYHLSPTPEARTPDRKIGALHQKTASYTSPSKQQKDSPNRKKYLCSTMNKENTSKSSCGVAGGGVGTGAGTGIISLNRNQPARKKRFCQAPPMRQLALLGGGRKTEGENSYGTLLHNDEYRKCSIQDSDDLNTSKQSNAIELLNEYSFCKEGARVMDEYGNIFGLAKESPNRPKEIQESELTPNKGPSYAIGDSETNLNNANLLESSASVIMGTVTNQKTGRESIKATPSAIKKRISCRKNLEGMLIESIAESVLITPDLDSEDENNQNNQNNQNNMGNMGNRNKGMELVNGGGPVIDDFKLSIQNDIWSTNGAKGEQMEEERKSEGATTPRLENNFCRVEAGVAEVEDMFLGNSIKMEKRPHERGRKQEKKREKVVRRKHHSAVLGQSTVDIYKGKEAEMRSLKPPRRQGSEQCSDISEVDSDNWYTSRNHTGMNSRKPSSKSHPARHSNSRESRSQGSNQGSVHGAGTGTVTESHGTLSSAIEEDDREGDISIIEGSSGIPEISASQKFIRMHAPPRPKSKPGSRRALRSISSTDEQLEAHDQKRRLKKLLKLADLHKQEEEAKKIKMLLETIKLKGRPVSQGLIKSFIKLELLHSPYTRQLPIHALEQEVYIYIYI